MTELGFLLELLLNHKLPVATRKLLTERIKEVEVRVMSGQGQVAPRPQIAPLPPQMANQSASTLAAMMRHQETAAPAAPEPVVVVAQTPLAQAAMASREQAIAAAISGKPVKGETRPRKF